MLAMNNGLVRAAPSGKPYCGQVVTMYLDRGHS